MNIEQIKKLEKYIKRWEENLSVLKVKEFEYSNEVINLYKAEIKKIREELKSYAQKHGCVPETGSTWIFLKIADQLKIRIEYNEPKLFGEYSFALIIIRKARQVFTITLIPKSKLFIPSIFNAPPKPNSISEAKEWIEKIGDIYTHLDKEFLKLKDVGFLLSYYLSDNKAPDKTELKKFDSILNIIEKLLDD